MGAKALSLEDAVQWDWLWLVDDAVFIRVTNEQLAFAVAAPCVDDAVLLDCE
jgi:hypothetical protein